MAPKLHLYVHTPVAIFKARINMATVSYPVSNLVFDGVTLGAYTDIGFDATLLLGTSDGADDLGRVRVPSGATPTLIPISRASKGVEDGTLTIQDNAYITVLDDYRVWAKIPLFDIEDGNDRKDGNIPVGNYNTDIPPVSNCGPGFADYIDPITNLITVQFPKAGVNSSFAVAGGETISTYDWDVQDGTITVGTAASSVITATFPAGFRYVVLTVVDSNGVPHTSRCPVLAIDPDADPTIKSFKATQRLEVGGQTLEIELFEPLLRGTYPDGTLVMFWWDEPATPGDRDHMKFIGWLDEESINIKRDQKGFIRSTTLKCVDAAGRLKKLPGFPQALSRIETESPWSYMPSLDMNKSLFYLAFWHSTAINIVDFILPADGDDYDAIRLDASGATLFDQINGQSMKMVPDHYLTCNSQGQLIVIRDWTLDDVGSRPASAPIITEDYWNDLSFDYIRHPKVHVLRSGAILASADFVVIDGEDTIPLVFCISPGTAEAFGQGTVEATENEGLALTQTALNIAEGHRYAKLNSRYTPFRFKDPSNSLFWDYEPALFNRVQLNIGADKAAQRGLNFTQASGQVKDVTVKYEASVKGRSISVDVTWEKESIGTAADTFIPGDSEVVEYVPAPFTPPLPNDSTAYAGVITGYILWDGTDVLRTWDLGAATPTWERIDTGISGTLLDGQYMHIDSTTVGMWLMSTAGIFFCADIMATVPSWTNKLTLATVQAADVAPTIGAVKFGSMTHYWSSPGHLCVATCPDAENDDYLHAYFWVTEDYGSTWTQVDMNAFTFGAGATQRCYYSIGIHGLASLRSGSNTLWAGRGNGRTGSGTGDQAIFKSTDGGYTWTKGFTLAAWSPNQPALLNPFPLSTDPSYGVFTVGNGDNELYVSTDAWATATNLTEPTGHQGGYVTSNQLQMANKQTSNNLHILAMFQVDASSAADIYESDDSGSTWSLLEAVSNDTVTPNGWPANVDCWILIENVDDDATPIIRMTLDNFGSFGDKEGNIATVLSGGTWNGSGLAGGFALPKVGVNA